MLLDHRSGAWLARFEVDAKQDVVVGQRPDDNDVPVEVGPRGLVAATVGQVRPQQPAGLAVEGPVSRLSLSRRRQLGTVDTN